MNWKQEKQRALAMINYWNGWLGLTEAALKEENDKCQSLEMEAKTLEKLQITPSTESQENHGSNAISAPSVSRDQNQSSTTRTGNLFVSNVMTK